MPCLEYAPSKKCCYAAIPYIYPQEVADKIFECATADTPVRNPVGQDAQMIMGLMGGPDRQKFLDQVEPLLIPQA